MTSRRCFQTLGATPDAGVSTRANERSVDALIRFLATAPLCNLCVQQLLATERRVSPPRRHDEAICRSLTRTGCSARCSTARATTDWHSRRRHTSLPGFLRRGLDWTTLRWMEAPSAGTSALPRQSDRCCGICTSSERPRLPVAHTSVLSAPGNTSHTEQGNDCWRHELTPPSRTRTESAQRACLAP